MVELGDHCHTHIVPRLKRVMDGEDPGGVTQTTGWKGGGGFRYYKLAPSLILEDKWGQPVINPDYNAAMLAEAMCKHMGFTYAPSDTRFWSHGYSTETDFIYVTTQSLSFEQLKFIHDQLGPDRTLMVCCNAYRKSPESLPNLTIKKIPQAVLARCEWGRDDYSMNVEALQIEPLEVGEVADIEAVSNPVQADLFGKGLS